MPQTWDRDAAIPKSQTSRNWQNLMGREGGNREGFLEFLVSIQFPLFIPAGQGHQSRPVGHQSNPWRHQSHPNPILWDTNSIPIPSFGTPIPSCGIWDIQGQIFGTVVALLSPLCCSAPIPAGICSAQPSSNSFKRFFSLFLGDFWLSDPSEAQDQESWLVDYSKRTCSTSLIFKI